MLIYSPCSFSQSEEETLTLTTYYPAPYGVYNEMRAKRMAVGDNYYSGSAYPWDTGGGCAGNEICNADLVVQGNVGIGTTSPSRRLHVAGDARVAGTLTVNTSSPIKLEYRNCEWIDGGVAVRPAWSVATCPAGKYVAGFHFLKSKNTEEDTEYRVTSTTVESRRPTRGSWAQSRAECCNFYLVTP
ncbi:MAG: hypothetical protein A3D27_01435 [Omnitrophica WOR_2 bacterium RIFCSPHIGHO2_02_FULL_46_37]|nr:MAG: hypothetical protein A3D27_01435 [Omnitrophica WOR_2 bacterium RIFCSPHIGHO2_02_FULL_46_37]OGX42490.1 MAG: hypothetical protein A3H41_03480 [Omnitrophica WOR_2 bacterium RIFCSPLOWO2_02_FULL_45_28]